MSHKIRLSEEFINQAKLSAKESNRTISEQIEHWASVGKLVENNPDLTYEFIKGILYSSKQIQDEQLEPYEFS